MNFDYAFAWSILPDLLPGLWVTFRIVICGFICALVLGTVIAMVQRLSCPSLRAFCDTWLAFFRNTPLLVQLYFLFFALPLAGIALPAELTGILGLGFYYGAYIAEALRGAINKVDRGQWEAARALDLPSIYIWRDIILPQALKPLLPLLGNYLIGMFKETPLLAIITIPELFQAARQIAGLTYRYTEPYTLMAILFLGISLPVSLLFKFMERRGSHDHFK